MPAASAFDDHLPLGIGFSEATQWLRGVEQWQMDLVRGSLVVGSPTRPMIIGQAPSQDGNGSLAFSGRSGSRVRKLLRCTDEDDFSSRFDAFNILPLWPGKSGKGDRFPLKPARSIARRVLFRSSTVLLFGRAGEAFGFDKWFVWSMLHGSDIGEVPAVALPHPSGVNRWWNDSENKIKAQQFFDRFLASATSHDACAKG